MLKHALFASVAAVALGLPAMAQDAPTRDTVVATVNGTEITVGQMIIAMSQLPPQYQQLPPDVLFGGLLDQIISQQLLADTLETVPARVEISLANQRRSLIAGEVVNEIAVAAVTEEALQAAYDATYAAAVPATEYNAAHILVATEEEAQAVVARLAAGEDFGAVAREVSTDTGSGANGGDLGWFGMGMMVPEFEAAVVAATIGTVTAPVQSQFGYHVILVKESREQPAPTLDEVRGELEAQLQQTAIEGKIAELMAAAAIVRPEDGAFDPAVLLNLDLLND
jgi:peptidyl-prolyl cis-trans isomerase C